MKNISIVVSTSGMEVQRLLSQGYCPISCFFNDEPIVDDLLMDRHSLSGNGAGLAARAYMEHYAARADDPRFVVPPHNSPSISFAIASLAGVIPHPTNEYSQGFEHDKTMHSDFTPLATTLSLVEKNPIGLNLTLEPMGDYLLAWNPLYGAVPDTLGYYNGVAGWINLLTNHAAMDIFRKCAKNDEVSRIQHAKEDLMQATAHESVRIIPFTSVSGFDIWHELKDKTLDPSLAESWAYPVVLAREEKTLTIMATCPNMTVAESVLGAGGLKSVISSLKPDGWTGDIMFAISPSQKNPTEKQLLTAAKKIAARIKQKK